MFEVSKSYDGKLASAKMTELLILRTGNSLMEEEELHEYKQMNDN